MTSVELIAMFVIMVTLAALPSTGVALVVTRSATSGLGNGVAVAAGVVAGDLVFVMLALFGLGATAEALGKLFVAIKFLAAGYLVWLGISLLTTDSKQTVVSGLGRGNGSLITSFLSGFLLTIGDVKAILFYLSLFPMFIDLSHIQAIDALAIVVVTIVSVGGVKVAYAFAARRIVALPQAAKYEGVASKVAGCLLLGAGGYIITDI